MSKIKKREALVFLNDHMLLAQEMLLDSERGRLYEMLRMYAIEGCYPDVSGETRAFQAIFKVMKSAQDKYLEKYEETCERNRIKANMRWHSRDAGDAEDAGDANQIKTNQSKTNQSNTEDDSALKGQEIEGVPGLVWL